MVDEIGNWKFEGIYEGSAVPTLFTYLRNIQREVPVECMVGDASRYHPVTRRELNMDLQEAVGEGETVRCQWNTRPLSVLAEDVRNRITVEIESPDQYFVRAELMDPEFFEGGEVVAKFPVQRSQMGIGWWRKGQAVWGTKLYKANTGKLPSLAALRETGGIWKNASFVQIECDETYQHAATKKFHGKGTCKLTVRKDFPYGSKKKEFTADEVLLEDY